MEIVPNSTFVRCSGHTSDPGHWLADMAKLNSANCRFGTLPRASKRELKFGASEPLFITGCCFLEPSPCGCARELYHSRHSRQSYPSAPESGAHAQPSYAHLTQAYLSAVCVSAHADNHSGEARLNKISFCSCCWALERRWVSRLLAG
jgi:hypothetical protein